MRDDFFFLIVEERLDLLGTTRTGFAECVSLVRSTTAAESSSTVVPCTVPDYCMRTARPGPFWTSPATSHVSSCLTKRWLLFSRHNLFVNGCDHLLIDTWKDIHAEWEEEVSVMSDVHSVDLI